jgi:molybdate transport system ATP-binding protein
MKQNIVNIHNLNINYRQKAVLTDLNWTIKPEENWLLCGESGSGKTTLAKAIANSHSAVSINFTESILPAKVHYVESWYQFKNLEGAANFYYQQRYTSQQAKEVITVAAELDHYGKIYNLPITAVENLLAALNFTALKNSQLIELSSGEHKKLQLVKALWLKPQLLILDLPYSGLDAQSRQNLNNLLDDIAEQGVQIILISNEKELPTCINRFAQLANGKLTEVMYYPISSALPEQSLKELPSFLKEVPHISANVLVKMIDVNISYGEKQVLHHIDWEIKSGERWLLQGHNGSGKSTLLSLINGDHPQAYANTIYLFGNKRGTGESIWDIKKNIGLISPEFHWYFDPSATVLQSIASGFFDSVGLFKELSYTKQQQVNEILDFFDLKAHQNELLNTLPLGKQRLALLARTIIKNPELLILDEPCQGLDEQQTKHFNKLVDELCTYGTTLIYVAHTEAQLPSCLNHQLILSGGKVINQPKKELA